jgi:K+-transporting ATPase A subunit
MTSVPHDLGKKIEAKEVKMAMLAILVQNGIASCGL